MNRWLLFGLLCVIASPAAADIRRVAPEPVAWSTEVTAAFDRANEHLQSQEWAKADVLLTDLTSTTPTFARGWYQLGYSALMLEDRERAARCWERSIALDYLPAESNYNLACALALQGKTERALDALEASVAAGYSQFAAIATDGDLETIREDERFEALIQPPDYPNSAGGTAVTFSSEGGWDVYGEFYEATTDNRASAPCLIMVHQMGSNLAEYFPIAPRLAERGFHCLTIDARGGGTSYGRDNRTVAPLEERGGGPEAALDMRAALRYLDENGFTGPRTLWGSSYSASRVFELIADKPALVQAGLSFSLSPQIVQKREDGSPSWAAATHVPIFACAPVWEFDAAWSDRFDGIASDDKWMYVPTEGGAHGSAMLRPDRNPVGYEAAWVQVNEFLDTYSR